MNRFKHSKKAEKYKPARKFKRRIRNGQAVNLEPGTRTSWRRWTDQDRAQLTRLARIHDNDFVIAKIMGRTPSAVAWQRRALRLPLAGRKLHEVESAAEVERLMRLAGLAA